MLCEHLETTLDEVEGGETLVITRGGRAIAELAPIPDRRGGVPTNEPKARFAELPGTDSDHPGRRVGRSEPTGGSETMGQ